MSINTLKLVVHPSWCRTASLSRVVPPPLWYCAPPPPQVQDYELHNVEEQAYAELEVNLGERLLHVNVVHTIAHASSLLERVCSSCGSDGKRT